MKFFLLLMLICIPTLSFANSPLCKALTDKSSPPMLNGNVVEVSSGDTVKIQAETFGLVTIRFYGIDAPELQNGMCWKAQPYSREAQSFVSDMVLDQVVSIRLSCLTSSGAEVGEIFINGKSVSREVLRAGLAWWYQKYAGHDLDLKKLAVQAMDEKRGLWQGKPPTSPWSHRIDSKC